MAELVTRTDHKTQYDAQMAERDALIAGSLACDQIEKILLSWGSGKFSATALEVRRFSSINQKTFDLLFNGVEFAAIDLHFWRRRDNGETQTLSWMEGTMHGMAGKTQRGIGYGRGKARNDLPVEEVDLINIMDDMAGKFSAFMKKYDLRSK